MPPRPHRPAALAWQVFRGSDAVGHDLLTEHQLRSSAWIRLRHDVYADARLERDHALACRAAALRLPNGVWIAGPSAAYLHGVEHAASFTDEVHVLVPGPGRLGAQKGIRLHVRGTPAPTAASRPTRPSAPAITGPPGRPGGGPPGRPSARPPGRPSGGPPVAGASGRPRAGAVGPPSRRLDGTSVGPAQRAPAPERDHSPGRGPVSGRLSAPGIPYPWQQVPVVARTGPEQAAWETAVWVDPVRAIGVIDALLAQGLTTFSALAATAEQYAGRPGGRRAAWLFSLADAGAQSPPESHLRLRLVLAGLPRPVTQHPVRLPSGLVVHPDLAWPEHRVAVEYDGQWHAEADRLHVDRARLNALVAAGWLVLHVTSRRLHRDFPGVLREVRAALASRGWRNR
ncbi:DUF559 domain-containing protein [Micromonospora sp. NPDC049799]|uniref:endonuclease domain-containing protein n=1 Tax=Micromonospora sp. NPDC049799 TaxID=3154741 RepID=UPI0033D6FBD2